MFTTVCTPYWVQTLLQGRSRVSTQRRKSRQRSMVSPPASRATSRLGVAFPSAGKIWMPGPPNTRVASEPRMQVSTGRAFAWVPRSATVTPSG